MAWRCEQDRRQLLRTKDKQMRSFIVGSGASGIAWSCGETGPFLDPNINGRQSTLLLYISLTIGWLNLHGRFRKSSELGSNSELLLL